MIVRTLASGSSGNCILIQSGTTAVLIDAGISCRKITQRLRACGLSPGSLAGVLVTHEHSDHVSGLPVLLKHHDLPVYTSAGTCQALARRYPAVQPHLMVVSTGTRFSLGALTITSFPTPHDAAESLGYILSDGTHSAAITTDLGRVPDPLRQTITGADLVLLETNYDLPTLRGGPYPYYLQERILSGVGHLCNDDAAELAVHLARTGTGTLVLAHLSAQNNTPELARTAVQGALDRAGLSPTVAVAPRDALSDVFVL